MTNAKNTSGLAAALTQSLAAGLASIHQSLPPDWPHWLAHYHTALNTAASPQVLLLESDPLRFCAAVIAFFQKGRGSLFLGNPNWKITELSQVAQYLKPDCVWASPEVQALGFQIHQNGDPSSPPMHEPLIYFPTGGSSGKIRFVAHSPLTLTNAVRGLMTFLNSVLNSVLKVPNPINSFCLLPLFHVGGFMQWWRSALTGGKFCVVDYGIVKTHPPQLKQNEYITSLVPTQLSDLLHGQPQFLQQFNLIFLGGAPAWPELLTQAQQLALPLAPTYGMTETAGQIATLLPTEFLQGKSGVGRILPHAEVILKAGDRPLSGHDHQSPTMGLITLKATSLFLGYYPHGQTLETWETGDLGKLEDGYLEIIGRQHRQIISGGENIDPQEIEHYLLDQQLVKDVVLVGLGDRHWGEVLTAIFVPQDGIHLDQIIANLKAHLAPHKCPKHWLPVPDIGRSPLGKINYQALQVWAEAQIQPRQ